MIKKPRISNQASRDIPQSSEAQEYWQGHILIQEPHTIQTLTITSQSAFERFQSKLPKHRIQKRQPAPFSTDPLIHHEWSGINWSSQKMIIFISDSIHSRPEILHKRQAGSNTIIEWRFSNAAYAHLMARPEGVGCYLALSTPTESTLSLTQRASHTE